MKEEVREEQPQNELSTAKLNSFNLILVFRQRYQINFMFQFHFGGGIKESVSMGNGVYVRRFAENFSHLLMARGAADHNCF